MSALIDRLLENNGVPDPLIRLGIRWLLKRKLRQEFLPDEAQRLARVKTFADELKQMPIAIETEAANEQHYEVPAPFYTMCLGPRLKYSSGLWEDGVTTLAEAEERMLDLYCQRAALADGQRILDLGCGWGSLSLYLAQRYPHAQIIGLSNAHHQREFIMAQAQARGLSNLTIETGNIVTYEFNQPFDRIVSIEMMEHMKNYQALFKKLQGWLKPEGMMLVHIFTHARYPYHFEDADGTDWLTRYFFTGGTMPSDDLFSQFQDDLTLTDQWVVNGQHYQKTAEAWLANMDAHRPEIMALFKQVYGPDQALKWWVYWRVFYMACAELWGYDHGREWHVVHYRFKPKGASA